MITSNHKKLVNACYPLNLKNSQSNATSPEPNSLSKLIYYCSTRPSKIQKTSAYLISYAQSQALPASFTSSFSGSRHSKTGLICTIKIFKALLENCTSHFTLLAPQLNAIIAIGLGLINPSSSSRPSASPVAIPSSHGYFGTDWVSQDLDIALSTIDLFSQYAQSIQFDCLQDRQLARNFLFFLAKFSSIAMVCPSTLTLVNSTHSPNQPLPQPKSARRMALMALESTIQAPKMFSSSGFDRQIRMIVPGLMAAITPSPLRDPDELLMLIHQARKEYSVPSDSSSDENELTQEIQHLRLIISPGSKPEKSKPTEFDLINYSIKTLNFLLSVQLTHLSPFEVCINTIFNQLESSMNSQKVSPFYDWFGQSLLRWAMPKHRSMVIDLIVHRLTLIALENQPEQVVSEKEPTDPSALSSKQTQVQNLTIFASMLKAMLRDPVAGSIQLLNTLNILHQILRLIESTLEEPQSLNKEDIRHSRDLLIEVIGSLVYTVYYDEQINDICKDLLARIKLIVTQVSLSPTNSSAIRSFKPSFLLALFDCLNCTLINSNTDNLCHLASDPSTFLNRSQPRHYPVSIVLWKEYLLILDYLRHEPECRSGFYQTLMTFLKFEAFSDLQGSSPHRVQQLVEFLGTFNILFYRSFIGALPRSNHTDINFSTSRNFEKSRIDVIGSTLKGPVQTVVGGLNLDDYHRDISATERKDIFPNSGDIASLQSCLAQIFAHQHYSSILVCLPMLRELDHVMTTKLNQSKTELTKPTAVNPSSSMSQTIIEKKKIIVDCIERIGKVWKIEQINQKNNITIEQENQGKDQNANRNKKKIGQVSWEGVIEQICNSPIFQEKSGLEKGTLKLMFQKRWTIEEAMDSLQGPSRNSHNISRRGSMSSCNLTSNQERIRNLNSTRSSPTLKGQGPIRRGPRGRSQSTTRAFKKSYLPVLFNDGSDSSKCYDPLPSTNGLFLSTTTSSSTTSVSDLRKTLLGLGFLPMGDRNTSSGHSSIFLDRNATTTHTFSTMNQTGSSSRNLFINNSTGDLAQFAGCDRLSSIGTSILTGRHHQRFNEFGAHHQDHHHHHQGQDYNSTIGLSPAKPASINSNQTYNLTSNTASTNNATTTATTSTSTTAPTSPTPNATINTDFLLRRKLTLDKRRTLTTQILNQVRKNSLHHPSRRHHSQAIQPPSPFLPKSPNGQVNYSDKNVTGVKGLGDPHEINNSVDNYHDDQTTSFTDLSTPTHPIFNHHLINPSHDLEHNLLLNPNVHISFASNFEINPPYNE